MANIYHYFSQSSSDVIRAFPINCRFAQFLSIDLVAAKCTITTIQTIHPLFKLTHLHLATKPTDAPQAQIDLPKNNKKKTRSHPLKPFSFLLFPSLSLHYSLTSFKSIARIEKVSVVDFLPLFYFTRISKQEKRWNSEAATKYFYKKV